MRHLDNCFALDSEWFQSTHSLRSATPPPPLQRFIPSVSIHALLAECDPTTKTRKKMRIPFQSTHSLRSATPPARHGNRHQSVSIHALLAECDLAAPPTKKQPARFNPRTPCGVRPGQCSIRHDDSGFNPRTPCGVRRRADPVQARPDRFQSTHSLRSATRGVIFNNGSKEVSIHALLAECDNGKATSPLTTTGFNPRTPCGVRLPGWLLQQKDLLFQSTHSLRSATVKAKEIVGKTNGFNPRTPCGVRPVQWVKLCRL